MAQVCGVYKVYKVHSPRTGGTAPSPTSRMGEGKLYTGLLQGKLGATSMAVQQHKTLQVVRYCPSTSNLCF